MADTLADTKAKLASGGQADILILGDSLTEQSDSYFDPFRAMMQARYGNAGAGYQPFSIWTGGGLDTGWEMGIINQDVEPHQGLEGLWVSTTGDNRDGFLTAQSPHIQLHYVAQPGGGTFRPFTWTSEFFIAPPISAEAPVPQVKTWDFDVPASIPDNRIWYLTQGTGTVTLLGQNNINSNPGVRIHKAANGGYQVANFLQRDFTFDQQMQLLHPDLVMVFLGANDNGSVTPAVFTDRLNLLIDRIQGNMPDAEVMLITPYDLTEEPRGEDPLYDRIIATEENIAAERGLGLLNLYEVAGNYEGWIERGYLDPDGIHFSAAGGAYLAELLFEAFVYDAMTPRWTGELRSPFTPDGPAAAAPGSIPEPAGLALLASMLSLNRASRRR